MLFALLTPVGGRVDMELHNAEMTGLCDFCFDGTCIVQACRIMVSFAQSGRYMRATIIFHTTRDLACLARSSYASFGRCETVVERAAGWCQSWQLA